MTDRLVFPFEDGGFREVKPGMRRRIFNGDDCDILWQERVECAVDLVVRQSRVCGNGDGLA